MMIMHSVSFSSKITQSSEPQTFYCENSNDEKAHKK